MVFSILLLAGDGTPINTHIVLRHFYHTFSDNKVDFATFLEIMYKHSQVERCQQEVLGAFQAHDKKSNGTVPGAELHHILTKFGEKLSKEEGEN